VEFPEAVMRAKAATTTPEWPHAFARLRVSPDEFLASYPCNHTHGICGDHVDELLAVAHILGIDARVYQ